MIEIFKTGDNAYYCTEKYIVCDVLIADSFIKNNEVYYSCLMCICNNRVISQKMLGRTKREAVELRKKRMEYLENNNKKLTENEKDVILNKMHAAGYKTYCAAAKAIGISASYLRDIINGVKPYTIKLSNLFDSFNIGLNDTQRNNN